MQAFFFCPIRPCNETLNETPVVTVVRHSVSLRATLAFVTGENYSVLEDLKLTGLLSVKALLCFLKRLWDVTVSSLCPADSSLNLKMFYPGF